MSTPTTTLERSAPVTREQPVAPSFKGTVILSHRSAAQYLLKSASPIPSQGDGRETSALKRAAVPGISTRASILEHPALKSPIDLLVSDKSHCRHASDLKCHCGSPRYPRGSFWQLSNGLFIASPELCFVQMACVLPEPLLVELGTNLCAKYYIHPITGKIMSRTPITTRAKISRYLTRATDMRGAKAAEHALQWVLDNSASPRETKSAILLSLPLRYGGYGFRDIVLNLRVDPKSNAHLVEQTYFSIDISIPEKNVGMEYYGEQEHPDPVKDRRRLDALGALGWKMIVVDRQRLNDMDAFEVAALQLAKLSDRRIRRDDRWHARASNLREILGLSGHSLFTMQA